MVSECNAVDLVTSIDKVLPRIQAMEPFWSVLEQTSSLCMLVALLPGVPLQPLFIEEFCHVFPKKMMNLHNPDDLVDTNKQTEHWFTFTSSFDFPQGVKRHKALWGSEEEDKQEYTEQELDDSDSESDSSDAQASSLGKRKAPLCDDLFLEQPCAKRS